MIAESIPVIGAAELADLVRLLQDAVEHDASVGYVIPVDQKDLESYWRGVAADLAEGSKVMVAVRDQGRIVGSTQIELCGKPNGRHRAEVQKVLVHSSMRRRGLGTLLMRAAETEARRHGRTLLVLDTESGSGAQSLYAREGYAVAGQIPRFAIGNRGGFVPTTYMFKLLDTPA